VIDLRDPRRRPDRASRPVVPARFHHHDTVPRAPSSRERSPAPRNCSTLWTYLPHTAEHRSTSGSPGTGHA